MKALVVGAGISGKSANKFLKKQGYVTYIVDDNKKLKSKLLRERLISGLSLVVISPGVALTHEIVKHAKAMNIETIGEFELGVREIKCEIVAITGTNGKTTTTSLVKELLEGEGRSVFVGGNIGIPVTSFAFQTNVNDVAVLEVSSFQLESIARFHPHIACILNITEDHLNRHKTMQNYINTKLRIFENQTEHDFAIINLDDPILKSINHSFIKSQIYYFSTKEQCKGCYAKDDIIYFNNGLESYPIMKVCDIPLKGEHNLSNVLAGLLCAILSRVNINSLAEKVHNFKGVSHRLEYITEINGVTFINDSKSTNISSTIVAMRAMSEPTTLILGGSDKNASFDELFENLTPSIKNIVLVGETKDKLFKSAQKYKVSNVYETTSFKEAVILSFSLATKGETVLLSPACASFDMFNSYEQRGKVFASLVREIEKSETSKAKGKKRKKVEN